MLCFIVCGFDFNKTVVSLRKKSKSLELKLSIEKCEGGHLRNGQYLASVHPIQDARG